MPKVVVRILPANLELIVPLLEKSAQLHYPSTRNDPRLAMGNINWKSPPASCILTEKLKTIPLSLAENNLCNGADDWRAPRETETPKLCHVACSCWQIKRTNSFAISSSISVGSRDSSAGTAAASQQTIHDWKQQHGINLQQCNVAVVSDLQGNQI